MNFGEVLSRAWNIIWKNKILWLFGLLAGFGGGGNNGSNFNYRFDKNDTALPGVERFFNSIPEWVWLLVVMGCVVLFILVVVIAAIGRAGLIRGAWLADSGETGLTFSRLFEESRKYFLRLVLLGILIFALTLTLSLILIIPLALGAVATMGLALICLLPLLCLLVPVFILIGVVVDLAVIAIVGEDLGIIDGLRRSWEVCRSHAGEVIVMAIILGIIGAVVGFVIGLPLFVVMMPVIMGMISQTEGLMRGGTLVSVVLGLIYLPILLVLNGILKSYIDSAWTVTFRRLTGRTAGTTSGATIYNAPVAEI